jgi:hypothetical protein
MGGGQASFHFCPRSKIQAPLPVFFLSVSAIHSCMVYVHELVVYEYI